MCVRRHYMRCNKAQSRHQKHRLQKNNNQKTKQNKQTNKKQQTKKQYKNVNRSEITYINVINRINSRSNSL